MTTRRFMGQSLFHLDTKGKIINHFTIFSSLEALKHTFEVIVEDIMVLSDIFSFSPSKLKVIVHDSCSTLKKLSTIMGMEFAPCYLHLFNLCFNSFWGKAPYSAKKCIKYTNSLQKRSKFVAFIE